MFIHPLNRIGRIPLNGSDSMKIKITNIDWDTDEHNVDLPQQVELEVDHEDEIVDKLSDEYGWCIYKLNYEIIK